MSTSTLVGWVAGWLAAQLVHWSSWQAPHRPSACSPQCITSSRASCPPPAPRCRRSTAEPLAGALRPSTGPWRFAGRRSPPRLAGARTAPWPSPPNPPAPKPAWGLSESSLCPLYSEFSSLYFWVHWMWGKLEIRSDYLLGPRHRRKCNRSHSAVAHFALEHHPWRIL